MEMQRLIDSIN